MLEETYLKFKKNILPKMKKTEPDFQEPVVEYCEPEQVIDICSYNHYPILDKSSRNNVILMMIMIYMTHQNLNTSSSTEFMKMCSKRNN